MATCTTTHGSYRCKHAAGHAGDCEAEEHARPAVGPYRDTFRARAYLRGMLDVLEGAPLRAIGIRHGVPPLTGEDDCAYRERVWRAS